MGIFMGLKGVGLGRGGRMLLGRDGSNDLWETVESIFNMGLEWSEVRTLHWRLLPHVKDFLHLKTPHVNTVPCILLYI
jgi:hypothetical protein